MLLGLLGPLILVPLGPLFLVPLGPLILVLLTFLHSPRVPVTQESPPCQILVPLQFLVPTGIEFRFSAADLFALTLGVPITQGSPLNFSFTAIFSSTGIIVPLQFSSVLVLLTFLHLHFGSPMSEGHPKDFSSTMTFLHCPYHILFHILVPF